MTLGEYLALVTPFHRTRPRFMNMLAALLQPLCDAQAMFAQFQADFSLDTAIDEDGDTTFLDRLEEPGQGPQDTFLGREQDEDVQEALAKVRKRIGDLGWDIVQERLTQDKPRTLEELGQRWGVSRERVRQVELKTKHFLARYLSAFNQDEEQLDTPAEADAA